MIRPPLLVVISASLEVQQPSGSVHNETGDVQLENGRQKGGGHKIHFVQLGVRWTDNIRSHTQRLYAPSTTCEREWKTHIHHTHTHSLTHHSQTMERWKERWGDRRIKIRKTEEMCEWERERKAAHVNMQARAQFEMFTIFKTTSNTDVHQR